MFFAAVALKFAFPITVYMGEGCINGDGGVGRSVTMQSISSSLKETMNPRDMMTDAIHNFHPQYRQYTQCSSDNRRFQPSTANGSAAAAATADSEAGQQDHFEQQHSGGREQDGGAGGGTGVVLMLNQSELE